MNNMNYKPLAAGLFIKDSNIEGQGLFTNKDIPKETNLGMSHLELGKIMIRTPLGGFINHFNSPNCIKNRFLLTRQEWNYLSDLSDNHYDHNFTKWHLITTKDIKAGEELTLKYTMYNLKDDKNV
tara:strand:+ start:111 stop:485 length:375 start_codon:yes stop_codon:yes gene_type:complete